MPRSSAEILSQSRTEIARGRPRAALRELELARVALLANADLDGLRELLELARAIRTLAPVDTKARERLLAATEEGIESIAPGASGELTESRSDPVASTDPRASFSPYALISTEQIFAPARAEIERQNVGRSLRLLEKARRKLLTRADVGGLGELIELTQRLPVTKSRHIARQKRLLEAAQQNVRYLGRRKAIRAGETWSDPFLTAGSKSRLPSLPPMTRRDKLIAAAIVVFIAGGITTWALVKRAPQRAAHAIQCPTGEQGGPTWSPNGKEIAFAKNRECGTQITVISLGDGRLRTVSKGYGVLPDWSPDGRTILYESSDGYSVVPVQGGKSRLLRSDDGDFGASWSPDGSRIAFTHGLFGDISEPGFTSTLYVMDANGQEVQRIIGHSCNPGTPAWSHDGKTLAFTCDDGLYTMRLRDGRLRRIERDDFSMFDAPTPSWSPDDRMLALPIWDGIELFPVTGKGHPRELVSYQDTATAAVAWSPNGKQIAFSVTYSGNGDGLYVIDRDGSHRKRLVGF